MLTDGFKLFKRTNMSAWPLLFINANLSPGVRYRFESLLCAGIILGKPKDFDSFLFPMVQELALSAKGSREYDAVADAMFTSRIYAPFASGDVPACAAAWTGGKGPGAFSPCRTCPIQGVQIIGTKNQSHYVPLVRPPGYPPSNYSINNLPPLREHLQYLAQARLVDQATTAKESKRRSIAFGVRGTPITSHIPGFNYPWLTPTDLMHMLENTVKNYVSIFSAMFKGLDDGSESYIIDDKIWEGIGRDTKAANATTPACFGRPIPNIAEDRTFFTAESYLIWATLYAPILLRGRFRDPRYYDHFMLFVSILERLCAIVSPSQQHRDVLRADILRWYAEYEE